MQTKKQSRCLYKPRELYKYNSNMKLRLNLLQTTKDCSYIKTFLRLQSPGSHNLRFAKKKQKKKVWETFS